nr:DNA polymerase III subunit alpha [Bacteroidota bacterium]
MLANCHTNYSYNYGTLPVRDLVEDAATLGYRSLALTDINSTAATYDFVEDCSSVGIRPLVGIDFRNMEVSAASLFIGLPKNNEGFRELNIHLSDHLHHKKSFSPRASDFEHVFVIYPFSPDILHALKPNEYLGIRPQDLLRLYRVSEDILRKKCIALYPISFKEKNDYYLHCLLRAVGLNTLLTKLEKKDAGERTECLCSPEALKEIYRNYPFLLRNTEALMDECQVEFDLVTYKNVKTFTGTAEGDREKFMQLCEEGLVWRYGTDNGEARRRLETEFETIRKKDFTYYYLITWDIIRYAGERGFYHVGRGSGANSIAAYCMGITDVDPIELNLYFERFLNMYRSSPPDFDIDFSWKERDEIIKYLFEKYDGRNTDGFTRIALLGSHSTYKFRAAVRELGKVYGLPKTEIDQLEHTVELNARVGRDDSRNAMDSYKRKVLHYGEKLQKFPHYTSVHSSGIVISAEPLHYYTVTDMPPKGFPITQIDMYSAEKLKLFKLDVLSQRGLGHIKDCIALVKEKRGIDVNIHKVNQFKRDPHLNDLMKRGETIGCYYIESPAMRLLLRKLECDNYLTLVAASSIIRPGVSDSGMAREFIHRHRHPDEYKPTHAILEELLKETYGVMVYQEDVIKIAHRFAKFTLAEADMLRRTMAWKFRLEGVFQDLQDKYFLNCAKQGYDSQAVKDVWDQMLSFAGFSFCKAHSASYAVESYQSLHLKANYPIEFMVAVINNFGGFYSTEFYLNEARRCGAAIEAPCINRSENLYTLHGGSIFIGFIQIKSLEAALTERFLAERAAGGPYAGLYDFCRRVHSTIEQINILIKAGAFRFTGKTKTQILWEGLLLLNKQPKAPASQPLSPQPVKEFHIPAVRQGFRRHALQEVELFGFPVCSRFDLLKV